MKSDLEKRIEALEKRAGVNQPDPPPMKDGECPVAYALRCGATLEQLVVGSWKVDAPEAKEGGDNAGT